ncbi:uncharacterized protein LOC134542255 [Bacillus rossius redtenbacheri]|uniref:uncharacterized protein LOC134542255 n=1 Tax=Bacillus rossius redtenbacheri TaxID=93214 RepID=UPI002FDE70F9
MRTVPKGAKDARTGLCRPPPPPEPPLAARYLEEELFSHANPGLFYRADAVADLRQLHRGVAGEEAAWDLRVDSLRRLVLQDAPPSQRRELLDALGRTVTILSMPPPESSTGDRRFRAARLLLCGLADGMEVAAASLRAHLLPNGGAAAKDPPTGRRRESSRTPRTSLGGRSKARKDMSTSRSTRHPRPSKVESQTSLTAATSETSLASAAAAAAAAASAAARTRYLEALFVETYHLVGRAVEGIGALLDSFDQL